MWGGLRWGLETGEIAHLRTLRLFFPNTRNCLSITINLRTYTHTAHRDVPRAVAAPSPAVSVSKSTAVDSVTTWVLHLSRDGHIGSSAGLCARTHARRNGAERADLPGSIGDYPRTATLRLRERGAARATHRPLPLVTLATFSAVLPVLGGIAVRVWRGTPRTCG